jgi:hypothetical protein
MSAQFLSCSEGNPFPAVRQGANNGCSETIGVIGIFDGAGFVKQGFSGLSGVCEYVTVSWRGDPYEVNDRGLNLSLSFSLFLETNNFSSRKCVS